MDGGRQQRLSREKQEYLKKLAHNKTGILTPDEVVRAAMKPSNILHDMFEWDDSKAAKRDRINTARGLLSSVVYVGKALDGSLFEAPYFHHNPTLEHDERGYIALPYLREDPDAARDAFLTGYARCVQPVQGRAARYDVHD